MYNEERKLKFVKDTCGQSEFTVKYHTSYFDAVEQYERQFNKDLCEFTTEEFNELFSSGTYAFKSEIVRRRIAMVRRYIGWCNNNGYCDVSLDAINDVVYEPSAMIKTKLVSSPKDLQEWLDIVFYPVESNTMDVIPRAYFWLAFSGVARSEITDLTPENVNLNASIIEYNGYTYPIYDEAYSTFESLCTAKQFRIIHPKFDKYKDRVPGNMLLRGCYKSATPKSIYYNALKKITSAQEDDPEIPTFKYTIIRDCGLFYRIHQMENRGLEPNFDEILDRMPEYVNKSTARARKSERLYGAKEDYKLWKKAFGYK